MFRDNVYIMIYVTINALNKYYVFVAAESLRRSTDIKIFYWKHGMVIGFCHLSSNLLSSKSMVNLNTSEKNNVLQHFNLRLV